MQYRDSIGGIGRMSSISFGFVSGGSESVPCPPLLTKKEGRDR